MLLSRLLLNGRYFKNGKAGSVGRRLKTAETHSCPNSDSKKPPIRHAGGNLKDGKLGLILQVFQDDKGNPELTPYGKDLDKKNNGKLKRFLDLLTPDFKMDDAFVVTDLSDDETRYEAVALSCCGPKDAKVNDREGLDEKWENVRCCFGRGRKLLESMSMNLYPGYEPDLNDNALLAANEGRYFTEWRPAKEFKPIWNNSVKYARINAQNWARYLAQMPANNMTPEDVVVEALKQLCPLKVKVKRYYKKDIEERKMTAFLAVARGSSTEPRLLECEYIGKADAPIVLLVAKGVTFDSGGLCLEKPEDMLKNCGMTGAAAALGTMMGLAALKLGLILQVFQDDKGNPELTPYGKDLDKKNNGKLKRFLDLLTPDFKMDDAFVVTDLSDDETRYEAVALSCCGPKDAKVNDREGLDEKWENVRCCFGRGRKLLESMSMNLYPGYEPDLNDNALLAANEGRYFTEWRPAKEFKPIWNNSVKYARINAQNWARYLAQMPANNMTPEDVVVEALKQLCPLKVKVKRYYKKDIEERKMTAFLAVARGSSTEPRLLECEYIGKADAPIVLLVAKGVTFDSGGLCLEKPEDMLKNCGMTGAAAALGTMMGLAALKAPVHVKLVLPLCENMISGQCLRVGEVVRTLKGLDVKVEDTDLEGHLILADALTYGQAQFKPKYVLDVAALTPGIATATGGGCYGCFTHNDALWKVAREAGIETGDRPWRFPIWDYYGKLITGDTPIYNLKNRGPGIASCCTGAAFLDKFVAGDNWLHYDITGVGKMSAEEAPVYLDPSLMTGRPTRALIAAIMSLVK